jgi:hypothetical protein
MQYRWGVLPTASWLHKCGLRDSKACPLCGRDDGGHHALSACPALSAVVTKRHNDAGTEIVEAICRGNCGGEVLLSDVGIRRRRATEELPETLQFCRFLRDAEYPHEIPAPLQQQLRSYTGSVPDALLFRSDVLLQPTPNRYVIVEIKYCRDTNPEDQTARAQAQHQELKDLIENYDPSGRVHVATLMLGVSGVIYKEFLENMSEWLGVEGPSLSGLAKRLHFLAANYVQKIWNQRAAMTKELQKCQRANWSKSKREHPAQQAPAHRTTHKHK